MRYELYLTKLKKGCDLNWDYSDKIVLTTLAYLSGDPGTRGKIISVASIDGNSELPQEG